MALETDINKNIEKLKQILRVEESFDFIYRTIKVKNKTACIFFIDGFVKDDIMEKLLEYFYSINSKQVFKTSIHYNYKEEYESAKAIIVVQKKVQQSM